LNASLSSGAPGETRGTQAFSGLTVVTQRAGGGNVVASVVSSTPGGSSFESQTLSAVVVSSAAGRNSDARVSERTPRLSG
jgi:hypothetical protein